MLDQQRARGTSEQRNAGVADERQRQQTAINEHPVCDGKYRSEQQQQERHRHARQDVTSTVRPSPVRATPVPKILKSMSNPEIASLVLNKSIKDHLLETHLEYDYMRAVSVRRMVMEEELPKNSLDNLPYEHGLDYAEVHGTNCEIVVG